ncbi:MAG TPA: EAL domain-containing protein [Steroidobacteraceae bacterium]|nr:EAL domain-containing protein [Steroidobacteraceae bacterium]
MASASIETGQTTIRASVLNEQVIEVAPGWVAALEGALPHARYRAIALYDARGEVLHCTSTDFGIEFRQALNDALDAFVLGAARESRFLRGDGTRTAVMLALRDLHAALQGVCLLVVEDTPAEEEDPAARFLTPAVQTILADVASEIAQTLHAIPAQKPQKPKPAVPLPLEAVYAQIREQQVVLRVQQLIRLRKAEGIRRFEVLLRHMVDGEEQSPERVMQTAANHGLASMIDRRVIAELIGWLHRNTVVWKKDPPAFSVNLSDSAVTEPHFISFVESCLQKAGLPPGLIGVEFSERVCLSHPNEVMPALDVFARIGVPVAIDDFNVVGAGMPILDHSAVRLLKLDAELTTNALQHRLTQARVVGLVQAAKVMGLQTVAKRVQSGDHSNWLTALGVDFVQSFDTAPPVALDSLLPG